jgi:hypothetical protein
VLDHEAVFVNALRSGDARIFDVIEQHHAHDFANGRVGIELYEELLYALRDSGMPEVMKEFERRFFPPLKRSPPYRKADLGPREEVPDQEVPPAVQDQRRRDWGRMSILYVAAFLGSFIIAFSALRMTATERPSVTAVTIPSAKAAASVSEATTEPLPLVGQKAVP